MAPTGVPASVGDSVDPTVDSVLLEGVTTPFDTASREPTAEAIALVDAVAGNVATVAIAAGESMTGELAAGDAAVGVIFPDATTVGEVAAGGTTVGVADSVDCAAVA